MQICNFDFLDSFIVFKVKLEVCSKPKHTDDKVSWTTELHYRTNKK